MIASKMNVMKLYLMILQELQDWETIDAALEKYNHLFTETLYSKQAFQFRNSAQICFSLRKKRQMDRLFIPELKI